MNFETVVGDVLDTILTGVYATGDGKYSLTTENGARYRTTDTIVDIPVTIEEMGWRTGNSIPATLTFNTSGRVIGITQNG